MTRPVYFKMGASVVRLVLDEDFDETPLYADAIDAQTGRFERDNRLIEQILKAQCCEPLSQAQIEALMIVPET